MRLLDGPYTRRHRHRHFAPNRTAYLAYRRYFAVVCNRHFNRLQSRDREQLKTQIR